MAVSANEPLAPQSYTVPVVGGNSLGFNNLSTTPAQVVAPDQQRKSITFHNPNQNSSVVIAVYLILDANGNPVAVSPASPGGSWTIVPGGLFTFTGDIQGAWGAFSYTGSGNGLTLLSSRG